MHVRRSIPLVAAGSSALLLASAYPPLEWAALAWIALIPLMAVCWISPPRLAFRLAYASGAVFWLINLFWLTHVTWFGWLLLSLYCALYTGVFGLSVSSYAKWARGEKRTLSKVASLIVIPLCWIGAEYLRSVLFTGFAWNPLGGSQFLNVPILQYAAFGGVYMVSGLMVLLQTALLLTGLHCVTLRRQGWSLGHPRLLMYLVLRSVSIILFLVFLHLFGLRLIPKDVGDVELRMAVIQPNIPQYEKWTPEFVDTIFERLNTLTQMAIHAGQPDLVVWPETAVPDYVRDSRRSYDLVRFLTSMGTHLLVGSMDIAWEEGGIPRYFNSSLLFDPAGRLVETYDKQHLVMFGEYVPLQRFLPFISAMTPIEASFDAGMESTVFTLDEPGVAFSVLICFEDTVSYLARRAVREGARLLVNQTNDAWFRESSASRQHMSHSVLRAVETGVPVVRSANTGVSCGIDRRGRIRYLLADENGNTFVSGFKTMRIMVPMSDFAPTFYTRHGDVLAWIGVVTLLGVMGPLAWAWGKKMGRGV